ncbi:MAG TPA: alpha/beta fold hydrolase [Candidatus Limnocylindria bacterium]|jgi:pimeloyl-ACP methyl ester carboxylesterase|nr:alpha/beta fold hydrolase [Candidatus Limnocylindria bacterium]
MRPLRLVLAAALLASCARLRPAELAATTPFELARTQGRFVEVEGLRVFAITLGAGPDVVLLHGNPASSYSWRKVLEPLAARHRVHAIDLPGYGFSDKPADAPYDTAWFARVVVGYLDSAGVRRAVLVGNSMGGYVATEAAILYPERVAGLVLLGAAGLPEAERDGRPLSLRMLTWPVLGPLVRQLPGRGRVRAGLRRAVYDPATVSEADVDAYYAPLRTAGGTNALVARLRQPTPADRAGRVRTIRAPTLVITGDTDRLVPPETARAYHALIAGSELLVLERTGHLPQEEQPERIVAEITRWVQASAARN